MPARKKNPNIIEKKYNSLIIEKAKYEHFETSNTGKVTVYFKSGIIYEFKNVKPNYARAFLNSNDREVGTAFNRYINAHFIVSKVRRTEKFYQAIEKAKIVDQQRKEKKMRKKNAQLV
jgi:hypothetical protein